MKLSFTAQIIKYLSGLGRKGTDTVPPTSKSDVDTLLAQAYMWDVVEKYGAAMSKKCWKQLEDQGIIEIADLEQGDHVLADGTLFECWAKVSAPVKRFNNEELCRIMKASKFKVPEPVMTQYIERAKIGTKGNKTLSITEKGV